MKKLLLLPLLLLACEKEPLQSDIPHPCGYDLTSYTEINRGIKFTDKFPKYNEPILYDCEVEMYLYTDIFGEEYLIIVKNDTFTIGNLKFIY